MELSLNAGVRLGVRYSGFRTVKLTRMIVEVGPRCLEPRYGHPGHPRSSATSDAGGYVRETS